MLYLTSSPASLSSAPVQLMTADPVMLSPPLGNSNDVFPASALRLTVRFALLMYPELCLPSDILMLQLQLSPKEVFLLPRIEAKSFLLGKLSANDIVAFKTPF